MGKKDCSKNETIEKLCVNCTFKGYACGDTFCNHPNCPKTTPNSEWPWLHPPFEVPDWCPLIKDKITEVDANV